MADSPPVPKRSRWTLNRHRKRKQHQDEEDDGDHDENLLMNVVPQAPVQNEDPPPDNFDKDDTLELNDIDVQIDAENDQDSDLNTAESSVSGSLELSNSYLEDDPHEGENDIGEQVDAENDQDSDSNSASSASDGFDLSESYFEDDPDEGNDQEEDLDGDDDDAVYDNTSSSEDEDADPILNLDHVSLQRPLSFSTVRTAKESLLLDIALSLRHNFTYEAIIQSLESKNILYGQKIFPTQKKELWKVLGRSNSGIVAHTYCPKCQCYVGKKKNLGRLVICPGCNNQIDVNKAKYFITISLKSQLEDFFARPETTDLLTYREKRIKVQPDAIEDIFDGEEYKRISEKVDMSENDFTAFLNLDGCKISKNAKTTIYPVFVRLNEIKPQLRQKFLFLAALFVDIVEPDMNTLLKPVVKSLNKLATTGITWTNKNQEVIHSRIQIVGSCVDGKARSQIFNMNCHCGWYGCTYCTIKGIRDGPTHRYPHVQDPPYQDRTDEGMRADMLQATANKQNGENDYKVRGHKGVTVMSLLKNVDLVKGSAADDLHNLFECAVKVTVDLMLTVVKPLDKEMTYDNLCNIIDARMQKIRTPNSISRKPCSPKNSIKNRNTWKGTQWRDFLFYYGVPCFQNLIPKKYIEHFELLSRFGYLLSMTSITTEDIKEAEKCILEFLAKFEEYYGIHRTRLNIHALQHAISCCRNLGPYWVYTTFNFESWNAKLLQNVSSPHGVIWQIAMRHMLLSHLHFICSTDPDISDDIKQQIMKILCKKARRKVAVAATEDVHVLGNPTTRRPTAEEQQVLATVGFHLDLLSVYPKIIIDSTEYEPPSRSAQSDNSCIYSSEDTFCTVVNIVGFEKVDGQMQYGMFVMEHDVTSPFRVAKHISRLVPNADLFHFLKCNMARTPAVKIEVLESTYIVAMPNTFGVD